jgi:hypothetical protein
MNTDKCIEENQTYKPLLCLNMIVKDEAHIIKETLEKLVKNAPIDYWVISDTGSTDGTQDIIKSFFAEKGIKGELYEDEWIDFGYNRTKALEYAYNKSKLLLIFDADDALNEPLEIPYSTNNDNIDGYLLRLVKGLNEYERVLLIKNNLRWRFKGIIHEILECIDKPGIYVKLNTIIHTSTSGNRNNNPNKYLNDAALLDKAYYKAKEEGDGIYIRYAFYCANSYYWGNNKVKAIEWYKRVLELNGWVQEKYIACYELANIYGSMNIIEDKIFYLIKSYSYDNKRVECITQLMEYYCSQGNNDIAYNFYNLIKDSFEKEYKNKLIFTTRLFSNTSSYYFYLPYIVIIAANLTGHHDTAIKMFKIIFKMKCPIFSAFHIRALFYNSTLYSDKINNNPDLLKLFNEYIKFLKENNMKLEFDFMDKIQKLNIEL